MRYKPLLMIVVSLLGQVAKSEEENPSSVIKNKLQVFMPERLSIQFGDPIFLPIAIVNTTDELLEGTTMIGSTPDIDFKLSAAETTVFCSHDEERMLGSGSSRKFAPQTVENFVILLNPWVPAFTAASANRKQFVIEADFGPIRRSIAEQFNSPGKDIYSPEKRKCIIEFSGSAFTDNANETIISLARTEQHASSTIMMSCPSFDIGGLALRKYVSPISWFLRKRDFIPETYRTSDPLEPVTIDFIRSIVKQNSMLARVFEFDDCIGVFRTSLGSDKAEWDAVIPKLVKLIDRCSTPESDYYTRQIAMIWGLQELPKTEYRQVQESLLNAFPMHATFFSGNRTYATVSLMSVEKGH